MSGVPAGGNMWKNIIIGVLTTVVAYVIVHFIFDKKGGKEELARKKEATLNAWKSIQDYKQMTYEKILAIACYSQDPMTMKKQLLQELEDIKSGMENVKREPNVDNKMLTLIDYGKRSTDELKASVDWYYDSLSRLMRDTAFASEADISARYQSVTKRYNDELIYNKTHDTAKVNMIISDLSQRYKAEFKEIEIVKFKPGALTRSWLIEGRTLVRFDTDLNVTLVKEGRTYRGTWALSGDELQVALNNGETYTWTIQQLNEKIFTFKDSSSGIILGACPQ